MDIKLKSVKRKRLTYIFLALMLFICVSIFAHRKGPPLPKPNPADPDPPGLPIDGGISLLLILGTAYGVYAIKKKG